MEFKEIGDDMSFYSGDPLTPTLAASKDAKRLNRSEAPNLLKILSCPSVIMMQHLC